MKIVAEPAVFVDGVKGLDQPDGAEHVDLIEAADLVDALLRRASAPAGKIAVDDKDVELALLLRDLRGGGLDPRPAIDSSVYGGHIGPTVLKAICPRCAPRTPSQAQYSFSP